MNFKTTLILLIVLLGVGGYLFFTRDTGEPKPKAQEHRLLDIAEASEVTKLSIAPASGASITLEKKGGAWRLTQPLAAAADAQEVDPLVKSFVDLKSTAELESKEAASVKTGLSSPQYTVTLTTPVK